MPPSDAVAMRIHEAVACEASPRHARPSLVAVPCLTPSLVEGSTKRLGRLVQVAGQPARAPPTGPLGSTALPPLSESRPESNRSRSPVRLPYAATRDTTGPPSSTRCCDAKVEVGAGRRTVLALDASPAEAADTEAPRARSAGRQPVAELLRRHPAAAARAWRSRNRISTSAASGKSSTRPIPRSCRARASLGYRPFSVRARLPSVRIRSRLRTSAPNARVRS